MATPCILDCDPGHDDAIAIVLAAANPAIDLLAVTTVAGNGPLDKVTLNARRVMTLAGIRDVPIAAGAEGPPSGDLDVAIDVHGTSALDGPSLPDPAMEVDPRPAAEVIGEILRGASEPVTIVATGPLTNVAAVLASAPAVAPQIREIVWMGGSTERGNRTPYAEFNAFVDPDAAARVLASGVPVTMVGLNLTASGARHTRRRRTPPDPRHDTRADDRRVARVLRQHLPADLGLPRAAGSRPLRGGAHHRAGNHPLRGRVRRRGDRRALDARRHGGRPLRPVGTTSQRARRDGARRRALLAPDRRRGRHAGSSERMTAEVAVVGSVNLDLIVPVERHPASGETVLGGDHRALPGGKGANQAVAAARLERRVAMVGRVGADDHGRSLRATLDAEGVDTRTLAEDPEAPTGLALIAVAADGDNTIVVSPGANGRVGPQDVARAGEVLQRAAVTLVQQEIPDPAVAAAVRAARGIVVLNPAPARRVHPSVLAGVDVLVPNRGELAILAEAEVPRTADEAAALAARLDGPRAVVVTLGADGALVVADGHVEHVAAPAVAVVDTTGAGDAFCGGLADALAGGADVVDAARWGVKVATASVAHPGAQAGMPTRAEL
jgi:ribokinase